MRGRRGPSCQIWAESTTSPRAWKLLPLGWKGPIASTGTAINDFRTAKAATNGNHRLCLKWTPQVNCHWSWPAHKNFRRHGTGLRWAVDCGRSPQAHQQSGWTHNSQARSLTAWKPLSAASTGPIVPSETIIKLFVTAKAATNINQILCLKLNEQVNYCWIWPEGYNLEGQAGANTELLNLCRVHKLPHNLKRFIPRLKRIHCSIIL